MSKNHPNPLTYILGSKSTSSLCMTTEQKKKPLSIQEMFHRVDVTKGPILYMLSFFVLGRFLGDFYNVLL